MAGINRSVAATRGFRRARGPWSLAPALLVLAVLLAGCTASAAGEPSVSKVVSLRVVRTSKYPNNHIPPFTATISDVAQVQKLYGAMLNLPYYPDFDVACPAEIGIFYDLTFTLSNKATFDALYESDSCPSVTLGTGDDIRAAWNTDFAQVFAQTVNLPVSQVTPKPQSTGPTAPTPAVLP